MRSASRRLSVDKLTEWAEEACRASSAFARFMESSIETTGYVTSSHASSKVRPTPLLFCARIVISQAPSSRAMTMPATYGGFDKLSLLIGINQFIFDKL